MHAPQEGPHNGSAVLALEAHEQTPLLVSSTNEAESSTLDQHSDDVDYGSRIDSSRNNGADEDGDDDEDRPLPKTQMIFLCLARVVEPIAFFSILPFVNQMVKDLGELSYGDVGFYTGLIESLFSVTQMIVMIGWGRASDRYGRKPVLTISLVGVSLAIGSFGLARSIWQMILLRCVGGMFAGVVVTLRVMFAEISTAKTQARAFSWFAFMSNIGIFIGPLIGGALAEPIKQYPGVFPDSGLFKEYPYFLSTLVVGLIGLTAAVTTLLFVEETKPDLVARKKNMKKAQSEQTNSSADDNETHGTPVIIKSAEGSVSTLELLRMRQVQVVLFNFSYVMLLAFSFTAVSPVYYFEPVWLGGFGLDEKRISLLVAITGLAQAFWMLVVFPPLQRRYGTAAVTRFCATGYPFFFLCFPVLNSVLRPGTTASVAMFWVLAPLIEAIGVGVSMAFTSLQLSVNDAAPSRQALSTLNALALMCNSGIRAFAPAAFTSLYSITIRARILNGQLIWVILFVFGLGFAVASRYVPEFKDSKARNGTLQDEETRTE